jgi:methylmalonyl-CoA mutase cobalamin-binding domain/chain
MEDILERIAKAVDALDQTQAVALVQEALDQGRDPVEVLQDGVMAGLERIGIKFEKQEYYLAELIMGGDISTACIALIEPRMPAAGGPKLGVAVIGTVRGDIHDIGMNAVARQLQMSGFEVHNIGVEVPSMAFVDKAREVKADIIGLSAFLTTTMPAFVEVLDYLRDMGLKDKHKVIIGGGVSTQDYADSIGADGWAANAVGAVRLCKTLVGK